MRRMFTNLALLRPQRDDARRGVFIVVGALCLVACMMFVAYSVDIGLISFTKTKMQNATDTAALAAAMEITNAISTAGPNVSDVFAYAQTQSRTAAQTVASLNGIYIDKNVDVLFGRRYYNTSSASYQTDWNAAANQTNAVKVIARRTGANTSAPDGKVPGMFSVVAGQTGTSVQTESIAYIEPRDMVVVHDFSRSMNFDSTFSDETVTRLTQAQIEANLALMWSDIQPLTLGTMAFTPQYMSQTKSNTGANGVVTFKNTSVDITTNTKIKTVKLTFSNSATQSFSISNETTVSGSWAGTGSNAGKSIVQVDLTIRKVGSTSQSWTLSSHQYNSTTIAAAFGLTGTYPYAGGSWSNYISFVQTNGGLGLYNYNHKYGGMTWLCYVMYAQPSFASTKDLWKTRHYPFTAIKEGHELLCDFLTNLGFDDHVGMVSYDSTHRVETTLSGTGMPTVNISANPITNDYASVKALMHYKQAAHYSNATNMTGGLKDSITLLDNYKRTGSRPAILLMTDGNGNTLDSGESSTLPTGWDWNALFDYDGNGTGDYTTSDNYAKATLKYVKQAVDKGYTVHCISVGADADRNLLKAIAFLGKGYYIDVPGGSSVNDMQDQVKAAFTKIAAAVPPARLVSGN